MKRWNTKLGKEISTPVIDAFLSEIVEVCKKHKLSLSHEDRHGAFKVIEYCEENTYWLLAAHDSTSK